MLVLTEKQVKELNDLILELPGKFTIPFLRLFEKFAGENQEAQKAVESKAEPVSKLVAIEAE